MAVHCFKMQNKNEWQQSTKTQQHADFMDVPQMSNGLRHIDRCMLLFFVSVFHLPFGCQSM